MSGRAALIERTSPTDLMQLASDRPGAPMQVAAILVLGPTAGLDLTAIGHRIHAVPRLRQRLVRAPFGCGRPVWVDDPGFDLRRHVGTVGCPAPGDETALLAVAAAAANRRLPADRPLWSATVVTGMADGSVALIVVLHHVLADGIGGLAVLARLVDGTPGTVGLPFPGPAPGRRALFLDAAGSRLRALTRFPAGIRLLRAALGELAAGSTAGPPPSSLNRPIGTRRRLAVARADVASVRQAAHAHGATVNDLVLAAVAGALHTLLRQRGENVDRFVISVPVSARRAATAGQLGNQVGVMEVPVTGSGDPDQRLAAVARTTRERRPRLPSASAALLGPVFRILAAAGVFGWFVDRQRLITTLVTNLRGPSARLSLLGAPITGIIPVSSITGNVTVAFAVLSYAGTLVVTVIADPQRCPDLPLLVTALQDELDRLSAGRPSPRPAGRS